MAGVRPFTGAGHGGRRGGPWRPGGRVPRLAARGRGGGRARPASPGAWPRPAEGSGSRPKRPCR